jgi:RNA polymerase sigma factor (sigma-70 family)
MIKKVNYLSTLSDTALASKAASPNNYEALLEIENRFRQKLYWHVLKSVHDIPYAKDIVERTLEAAGKNLAEGRYKEKGKLINWLYAIARNIHEDDVRTAGKHLVIKLNEEIDLADDSSETVEEEKRLKELLQAVGRALSGCSQRERVAFILSSVKGQSWEAIGRRMGIKWDSARKEAYRCRKHVRRLLEKFDKTLTKTFLKRCPKKRPSCYI